MGNTWRLRSRVRPGRPEGQSRINYQGFIQCLVHHGYVVFVPNVRGSTGYGRAYADLDDVKNRMDSVADLEYGAAWLAQQSEVDGNRVFDDEGHGIAKRKNRTVAYEAIVRFLERYLDA